MRFGAVVAILLSLCLTGVRTHAQQKSASAKLSLHDRVWIATQIYASVNSNFAHWRAVRSLDFDKEFQAYLDQITATDDRRSFDMYTLELIAKLMNGHTRFSDRWLTDNYGEALGFGLRPLGTSWAVGRSKNDELHAGDVINAIDGKSFEDFFQSVRKYIATSSERQARFALEYCPYLFPESFTLTLSNGHAVHITRQGASAEKESELKSQEKEGAFYVQIPSFGDSSIESLAVDAIERHSESKAIILDVRGNGGGSTPQRLIAKLMKTPYHIWRESTPETIGFFRSVGAQDGEFSWSQTLMPSGDPYMGEIFILVDGGCASACEDFVAPFRETHRAVIIGEATWGSTGQTIVTDFHNGMSLSVSTKRESFPDGSQFEGIGIMPDIEVRPTSDDLRAGRDPVLDKAMALVGRSEGGQKK